MCERFPQTPVILDHVGGVRVRDGIVDDAGLQALRALAGLPRVMVKFGPIHGLGDRRAPFRDTLPLLRAVVEAFGAERCMWESDLGGPIQMTDPQADYAASVDLVRQADFLTPEQRDLILGGTASRLFWGD